MTYSGKGYTCSAGETFDSVALLIYGDEKYACELLGANPHICTVPVFEGGETLLLPVVEIPEDEGEENKMPDRAPWKEG